jgi:hypothetical protein
MDGQGAASHRTSITLGSVVGTGDNRQGVLGGAILSPDTTNMTFKLDFSTDKTDLSAVNLYGLRIKGAKAGVLLDNNSGATETNIVSTQFINCGEIVPGTTGNGANMLNCFIIDPYGATNNRGLRMPSTHNIKKINCITSGTPTTQTMIHLNSSGTYEVAFNAIVFYGDFSSSTLYHGEASANSAVITIAKTNGSNPDSAEFNKSGSPPATVTDVASLTLKMIVTNENGNPITGALAYIDNNDQSPFILNTTTDGDGVAQSSYSGSQMLGSRWRVRKYGYKNFKQLIDVTSADITLYVTLFSDPQQT